jgi:protein-tyrosine-phosphatase
MRVLFLCTGNSARSQMAEALTRHLSKNRIEAVSAGTAPQPAVHPLAIATLRERYGIDPTDLVPKSVDRFLKEPFDYVITVCDHAAEACPVFPGHARRLHWSFEDPAAVENENERRRAFANVAEGLAARIKNLFNAKC